MTLLHALTAGVLTLTAAQNPAPAARVEFEVASVKPFSVTESAAVTLGIRMDGAQVRMVGFTMRDLLSTAYRLKLFQIKGPDWISTERYDINAKLPAGVSPEKLPEMLQTLLNDRFALRVHRDQNEMPVYALLIGKPPLKLREAAVDNDAPPPTSVQVTGTGSASGVAVNLGNGSSYSLAGGKFDAKKIAAPQIAAVLERFTDRPMVDLTALKGAYDFDFPVTPEDMQTLMIRAAVAAGVQLPAQALRLLDGGGNPIEGGVEQLGLKLEARRMPIEIIVVDQIQKTPTEN